MLTKKYYIQIAAILKDAHEDPTKGLHSATLALANMFEDDNPNFDRDRFLVACGLTGGQND